MLRLAYSILLACAATLVGAAPPSLPTGPAADLVRQGLAAEASQDVRRALDLFLAAEKAGTPEAFLLQKIARQYSDLVMDLPTREEQRAFAQHALDYSKRAVALEPRNAVNVLSVAISYGKLALASDTRDKVRYSRLVREEAERALALDANYAWAHHVLGRWHAEVAELGGVSRTAVRLFYGGLPSATLADAMRHLERAVALEPDELQHHLELGFVYLKKGETDRARASLERGLALPSRARIDEPAKARARTAVAGLRPSP
ncbi:MAG: hypothetical protein V4773_05125 [Verrucomicrobiota bacterium]